MLHSFYFSQNLKMGAFYVVLIATILGSAVVYSGEDSGILYDDLDGIGAIISQGSASTEDKISESAEVTRDVFRKMSTKKIKRNLKKANRAAKSATRLLEKTKIGKKYAKNAKKYLKLAGKFTTRFIPFASLIWDLAETIVDIYSSEKNLDRNLMDKIIAEVLTILHKSDITKMEIFMKTVKRNIRFINDTIYCIRDIYEEEFPNEDLSNNTEPIPQPYLDEYLRICTDEGIDDDVSFIKNQLDQYVEAFDMMNSSFRYHALLSAPIFIELGLIVPLFEPMAREFIRGSIRNADLSCRYRNSMVDFLPFVLEARFDKVDVSYEIQSKVRNEPYNPNGYNSTPYLHCKRGCTAKYCLTDEFGAEKYERIGYDEYCQIGYLQHLRHLVEDMFPIDVLSATCNKPLGNPTGNSM